MPVLLSVVFTIVMFVFAIIFLVQWYRKRTDYYFLNDFGFVVGGIFVVLNVVILISSFSTLSRATPSVGGLLCGMVFGLAISFFRMGAFAVMGIYYATLAGMPAFPLLTKKWQFPHELKLEQIVPPMAPVPDGEGVESEELDVPEEATLDTSVDYLTAQVPEETFAAEVAEDSGSFVINAKDFIITTAVVALGGIIYSAVLFLITKPGPSQLVQQMNMGFGSSEYYEVSFTAVVAVLIFAFSEEIVFRLGIQNYLAEKLNWKDDKYWMAILVTALLWTIGHAGVLTPDWVKLAQIFPVGLALGWLYKRNGTESTIIAHAIFNVVLVFLAGGLIQL